jgi:hypothetical protein
MAKGMASATNCGSESPVKTSELPSPVNALATAFIANLLIEQDKEEKHKAAATAVKKSRIFINLPKPIISQNTKKKEVFNHFNNTELMIF